MLHILCLAFYFIVVLIHVGGQSGVFEIEELCTLLKNDNVRDVCVITVPPEYNYVDFLIFGTGRSTRHIRAVAEYIKWAVS